MIIGRDKEVKLLQNAVTDDKSHFIAVYGRRRVGKTFLVKQVLGGDFSFSVTGMANVSNSEQLKNFQLAMQKYTRCPDVPTDWLTAFSMLEKKLTACSNVKLALPVFLDKSTIGDTNQLSAA